MRWPFEKSWRTESFAPEKAGLDTELFLSISSESALAVESASLMESLAMVAESRTVKVSAPTRVVSGSWRIVLSLAAGEETS